MTIETLRDNVRRDLKIDPGKEIWTDAELVSYLNEGVNLVYSAANMKFEWKDGTIALLIDGTAAYDYPSDFRRILWAKTVDGDASSTESDENVIQNVTDWLSDFQQGRDMDQEGEVPGFIYEEGNKLKLWPIPNSDAVSRFTIKFKYSEYPDVLTTSDTPDFAASWHYILEWYAKYRAWGKLPGKEPQSKQALDEWSLWKPKAIADMLYVESDTMTFQSVILPSKQRK